MGLNGLIRNDQERHWTQQTRHCIGYARRPGHDSPVLLRRISFFHTRSTVHTHIPHSTRTGNVRQLRPGGLIIKLKLPLDAAEKSRSTSNEVTPLFNRPMRRLSLSTIPAESFKRNTYS